MSKPATKTEPKPARPAHLAPMTDWVVVPVRLSPTDYARLAEASVGTFLRPAALARKWMTERLNSEQPAVSAKKKAGAR